MQNGIEFVSKGLLAIIKVGFKIILRLDLYLSHTSFDSISKNHISVNKDTCRVTYTGSNDETDIMDLKYSYKLIDIILEDFDSKGNVRFEFNLYMI